MTGPAARRVVRIDDLRPPAQRAPQPPSRPWLRWLRWIVGFLVVVALVLVLAKSIPAAPRPELGPPSTPAGSSRSAG